MAGWMNGGENQKGKDDPNERPNEIQSIMYWNKSAFYQLFLSILFFSYFVAVVVVRFSNHLSTIFLIVFRGGCNTWYWMGNCSGWKEEEANNQHLTFNSFSFGWAFSFVVIRLREREEKRRARNHECEVCSISAHSMCAFQTIDFSLNNVYYHQHDCESSILCIYLIEISI